MARMMRLLRVGPLGSERHSVLRADGTVADVSAKVICAGLHYSESGPRAR